MVWLNISNRRVWAGRHQILGPVVFDPFDQANVPDGRVRLYIVGKNDHSLLDKAIAKQRIDGNGCSVLVKQAAKAYETFLTSRRVEIRESHPGSSPAAKTAGTNSPEPKLEGKADQSPAKKDRPPAAVTKLPQPPVEESEDDWTTVEETDRPPGICTQCACSIPAERMKASPNARRCVSCQAAWEQATGGEPLRAYDQGERWFPRSAHWRSRGRKRK